MRSNKEFFLATASLLGTIIGGGIFAIPYLFAKSGILLCTLYLLILGGIVLLIHLLFGEIVLATKEKHRLIGYAHKYLGKKAKILISFSTIFGTTGALLAYIILGGNFLNIIFPFLNFSSAQLSIILWFFLSLFIFLGIRTIVWSELLMNIGFFGVISLIFFFSIPKINFSNVRLFNAHNIFLPYGVILFSLIGWNAIPEIEPILKQKRQLKKTVIFSFIVVLAFYFLFGMIISGVTGEKTSQEAFRGLSYFLGEKITKLGGVFGLFAVCTSFLVLANYLKNALRYDYNFPKSFAGFLACFPPFVLFLLGFQQFIEIISLVGIVVGAIEGITVILIYKKLPFFRERKPEYKTCFPSFVLLFSQAIFVLGVVFYGIFKFLK